MELMRASRRASCWRDFSGSADEGWISFFGIGAGLSRFPTQRLRRRRFFMAWAALDVQRERSLWNESVGRTAARGPGGGGERRFDSVNGIVTSVAFDRDAAGSADESF